ncbi:MAG: hypothetical protein IT318_05765 [Anaerolineales bacterium]|nr:hypothetical protein [Anaerolineales bacterium]
MAADNPNIPTTILAETQNYLVWTADEPDGETTFNVELGNVTLHFFREEWDEFLRLIRALPGSGDGQPSRPAR